MTNLFFQELERRLDGMPSSATERALRRMLAVRVAMPHTYFDDGEASGHEHGISIDFMREPVADIEAKLCALNVARSIAVDSKPANNRIYEPCKVDHVPRDQKTR